MPSPGSSVVQNCHSRNGQKPQKEGKKPPQAKEKADRLSQLKAGYPELYEVSKTLAVRAGVSSSEMDSHLVTFMENVIKKVEKEQRTEQLLADNKRRREQGASP